MKIKRTIGYLIAWLLIDVGSLLVLVKYGLPEWLSGFSLVVYCILIGGIGGVLYCLRGIYLSACVRNDWDNRWLPWYLIRPIASLISGGVSFLFLKAGLLILDSAPTKDSSTLGFLALAFVAGYNVDKFMTKIEQIAESAWGIKKSRSANDDKS
jgi:hypothetical protein